MTSTRNKLVQYLLNEGKTGTWEEIGSQFGISARQARYWWNAYNLTPSSEEVELEQSSSSEIPTIPTDVPRTMEITGMTVNASGSRTYRFKPRNVDIDPMKGVQEALANLKVKPIKKSSFPQPKQIAVNIADVHLGMSTEGTLFDQDWCLEELYKRLDVVIDSIPNDVDVFLNLLGDFADGERGKTASNSHKLEQNMDDQEIFSNGVESMMYLTESIFTKIKGNLVVNWVSNSNHPTVADFVIGSTVKLLWQRINPSVQVNVLDQVYNPIKMGDYYFILTHGKDRKFMKRGLPKFLGNHHISGIERLMNHHSISRAILLRGDLHQYSDVDYYMFRDIMTPSFAYPSGWVSANFLNPFEGGFTILQLNKNLQSTLIKFGD